MKKNYSVPDVFLTDGTALPVVSSLSFLGVVFSKDLKWNLHFDKSIKKACKRLFIIRNLRRSGCPQNLMFSSYVAFIRSVLLYGFPVFCNAPDYLFAQLLKIEKRVFNIIGSSKFPCLAVVGHKICSRLMMAIEKHPDHLLRPMFLSRDFRTTRAQNSIRPPFARTKRFSKSFIKFCK